MNQEVILVNEKNEPIGKMEKLEAHRKAQLHRAFSVYIFNSKGQMLLQRRALNKYHSGGLWTNACCSHPAPGEETIDAAVRRLEEEMGFRVPLQAAFDFVYKTGFDNGLTEFEFDQVFVGLYDGAVTPNADEVCDYTYQSMEQIKTALLQNPRAYTSWFTIAWPRLESYLENNDLINA